MICVFLSSCVANTPQEIIITELVYQTVEVTSTLEPTNTPTPTITSSPTPPPSPTPTPIPTLAGVTESIPDPRVHPDFKKLFYTKEAIVGGENYIPPIPQFVNAMKMAGTEILPESILNEIKFEEYETEEGINYLFAVFYSDPDPSTNEEILEGYIPIAVGKLDENSEWQWEEVTYRELGDVFDLKIGTEMLPHFQSTSLQKKYFNVATITYNWGRREPEPGVFNTNYVDREIELAHQANMASIRMNHITFHETAPDWLRDYSQEDLIEAIQSQVRRMIRTYYPKGVDEFNVVNEPWNSSFFSQRLGRDNYINVAFEEAEKIRNEIIQSAKQNNEEVPIIRLGFSNADNHHSNGKGTQPTLEIATRLANKGLIDYIDVHYHLKSSKNLPRPDDVVNILSKYRQIFNKKTNKPLDVKIGELDFNIYDLQGTNQERYLKQAQIGKEQVDAILDSGVTDIAFWGTADYDSWYEAGYDPPQLNADALLFDDNNQAKPIYYAILSAIYSHFMKSN